MGSSLGGALWSELCGAPHLAELKRSPGETAARGGPGGSSSASLHAKTFAVDGAKVFVGSFNFDPRSARLNTEMGLVIEDPELAGRLRGWFDTRVPMLAYEVKRAGDGTLTWTDRTESSETRYDTEPETGFFLRAWVGFLSLLPIEREL